MEYLSPLLVTICEKMMEQVLLTVSVINAQAVNDLR